MKLSEKVNRAKAEIDVILNKNPSCLLWRSIKNQLEFISKDITADNRVLKNYGVDEVDKIILGVQSIRELDSDYPSLSNLLCDIDYEYKDQYGTALLP